MPIQQAHATLLQAQQDLAIFASMTPGMTTAGGVSSSTGVVRAGGQMQGNSSSDMIWNQAQAQAQAMQQQQQQQQQQQPQAAQQHMQVNAS